MDEQVPTKKPNENSFPMPFSAVKTNNENFNDDENIEIKQIDTDNNAAKEIKNDNAKDKEEQKDKDNKEKDKAKADKKATKKLIKELSVCKSILEEMEVSRTLNAFHETHSNLKWIFPTCRFMRIRGHFYYQLIPSNFQRIKK